MHTKVNFFAEKFAGSKYPPYYCSVQMSDEGQPTYLIQSKPIHKTTEIVTE